MNQTIRLVAAALLFCGLGALIPAQSPAPAKPISFDVASVKPNNSGDQSNSNFPLGPGDVYTSNGGHFTATGYPLLTYIFFAYRVVGDQAQSLPAQLPGWATTDRFDIVAKTDGDPAKDTKNQMRLMMRSLLAERFHMTTHYETRQVPVFGLLPIKPGKTGPKLQAHPADQPCPSDVQTASSPDGQVAVGAGFPTLCGGFVPMPSSASGRVRIGARNVTMAFIANGISNFGSLGRPVLDQTGLGDGNFDMVLEWVPEINGPGAGPDFQPDPDGPGLLEAVKDQLGLRLESQKGPSDFLVIDHIEHPTAN